MTNRFLGPERSNALPCELSVVVPCYNEQECLLEMFERVSRVCNETNASYEIVLVDDGSSDRTWSMIADLHQRDPRVVAIKLSRNHGHQLALTCGLQFCRGERILVIDADLQDPPELLPRMMQKMDEGADVVYGQRAQRRGETRFKLFTAKMFYRLLGWLSDVQIPMDVGDFRLMSRRALNSLNRMPESHRFIRGMVSWVGYRQEALIYDREIRFAGETKYPLRRMVKLAMDAVVSFSTRPLELAGIISLMTAMVGVGVLLYAAISYFSGQTVSGWTSMIGIVSLLASVQLAYLWVIGFYLGRLYEQSKDRPLFIVEEVRQRVDGGENS